MTREFRARAHAKVNLHLGVGELRPDGFHEVVSVFQSLDLHDELVLQLVDCPAGAAGMDGTEGAGAGVVASLTATGPHAVGVPEDARNLAWRAVEAVVARLLQQASQQLTQACTLVLHKNIPAAGGMAGGSADAAAALRLANRAFSAVLNTAPLPEAELLALAADLGSDVPFTLRGGTAVGTGRGEQLAPMLSRGEYIWAIITNSAGLSTPAVFHKLDEMRAEGRDLPAHLDTQAVSQALVSGDVHALAKSLRNDLQPAALSLRPDLRKVLDTGTAAGALAGIVSGSGPTCAFLCADVETAQEVVAQVTADNRGTRGLVATGPAAGAVLL